MKAWLSVVRCQRQYIFVAVILISAIFVILVTMKISNLHKPNLTTKKPSKFLMLSDPKNIVDEILDRLARNGSNSRERPKKSNALNRGNKDHLWENSPRLTIQIRMYYDSVSEYWQVFAPSYLLFWPKEKWKNSDLMLIFDEESVQDHQASTMLSLLPPYPKIVFDKAPPPDTLCSHYQREGYSRQMYSNFYADLYTDAAYIGIADTDTFFSTKVVIEDLFENGKPRILGYNGCCSGWEKAASAIVDGKKVAEFMIGQGFPFIVKREHFKLFREHVMTVYNETTFEKCFHKICSEFRIYSQYDLLGFYLFVHHRDDYSWHIFDRFDNADSVFNSRMTNDPEVLAKSSGKMAVMKHAKHADLGDFPFVIYDYICTAASFSPSVGSCQREPLNYRDSIRKSVEYNQLTYFFHPPVYWAERKLPTSAMYFSFAPAELIPENSRSLLDEHYELVKLYNGSWHW